MTALVKSATKGHPRSLAARCLFYCLVLLGCIGATLCRAQESPEYLACSKKASTQTQINACAVDEAKRVDDELNRVYRELLSKTKGDSAQTEAIRRFERAWIAYRDGYMQAMYPAQNKQEYGSIYQRDINLLGAKLTRRQIEALLEISRSVAGQ